MRTLNYIKTLKQELQLKLKTSLHDFDDEELNAYENELISKVKAYGVAVVPNFYSEEQCATMRNEIDQLLVEHKSRISTDDYESDKRLFAANQVSDKINSYYTDSFLKKFSENYIGESIKDGFTLAARMDYKANNPGSGGGWHRDSALEPQIKAITYLSNVSAENGPYQYLVKSHKSREILKLTWSGKVYFNQHRFKDELIQEVIDHDDLATFEAKQGTLILTDTRGIHRGMPIAEGSRYALTNYYFFDKPIEDRMRQLFVRP
ncbi:MAG: hypothetical protein CL843_13335 [Crocinitomicaceae bacterium]|nr:hypothetical protein [Crocinitomicaceae bacterium]|tara:strand:+ start:2783 stop:3571 length:789 start_codon:yes stop_codon:yes gene_type:complete